MSEEKKSYYAIIPASVRYDKKITPNAKLLYGEITALCNEKGYCWASNKYFADLYEVSKTSISKWVQSLLKAGYIEIKVERAENKQILHRYITLIGEGIQENLHTPMQEKFRENTTCINNTINNTCDKPPKQERAKKNLSTKSPSYNNKDNLTFKPYDNVYLKESEVSGYPAWIRGKFRIEGDSPVIERAVWVIFARMLEALHNSYDLNEKNKLKQDHNKAMKRWAWEKCTRDLPDNVAKAYWDNIKPQVLKYLKYK